MVKLYGVLPDGVHFVYMQSQQKTTHKQKQTKDRAEGGVLGEGGGTFTHRKTDVKQSLYWTWE